MGARSTLHNGLEGLPVHATIRIQEDGVEQIWIDGVKDARERNEVDGRLDEGDKKVERHSRERRHVLGDPLVRVVNLRVNLDFVIRLLRIVLACELGGHPLPPVER